MVDAIGVMDGGPERIDLLQVEPDGLAASLFHFTSDQTRRIDMPSRGAGQYAVVVAGSLRHEEGLLGRNSCLYRFNTETALTLTAADAGSSVLLLQFPVH